MRRVGNLDTTDPGRGGACHSRPDPGRLKGSHGQERGGGLAVRAGDPDDVQVVAGVAVPPGGRAGEGGRCRAHDQLGQVYAPDRPLHEGHYGTTQGRRFGEVVSVDMQARDRHEQAARPDRP